MKVIEWLLSLLGAAVVLGILVGGALASAFLTAIGFIGFVLVVIVVSIAIGLKDGFDYWFKRLRKK